MATDVEETIKEIIISTLQLGERGAQLNRDTQLLGSLPEFDSMAVVSVLTAIEDAFGISVADDEVDAETFETIGALSDFVEGKV